MARSHWLARTQKISPYLCFRSRLSSLLLLLLVVVVVVLVLLQTEKENSPMSFTPSCHCHSKLLFFPPTHLPRNARSSMKANRDLLSPSADRCPSFPLHRQWRRELPFGTSAIADQYGSALTAAAPLKGDISVFLQTGAVMLLAYFIANFVVPNLISKYLGFDKINEGEDSEDDDKSRSSEGGEEERDKGTQANSRMTKKRGFNSTRR